MVFSPSTTIHLCQVDFDETYKNVVYFASKEQQKQHFLQRTVRTLTEYLTVRTVGADGQNRTSIRVNMSIDEFSQKPANYIMYCNENLGNKYIFAFITGVRYISEGTTELFIETDVFQTWLFDVKFHESFVVREHSETDEAGDNVIPESFNPDEFLFTELSTGVNDGSEWGYLVTATEQLGTDTSRGTAHSGIYQGLYFYFYDDVDDLNSALNSLENEGSECIVSISVIPYSNLAETDMVSAEYEESIGWHYVVNKTGFIKETTLPSNYVYNLANQIYTPNPNNFYGYDFIRSHNGYRPKNNKLYTYPFYCISVSNHNGQEGEYRLEDFDEDKSSGQIQFVRQGDITSSPSAIIYPRWYKGIAENIDVGLKSAQFPQCAFNTDTYKLWLAKNQYTQQLNYVAGGIGAVSSLLTLNGEGLTSSALSIANTINTKYQASREPNKATQGNVSNNLLTAAGFNKFSFYIRTLRKDLAESIDNYFTMYGYACNKVKMPNLNVRKYFTYVQTIDVNITGNIPQDDLVKFKQIFNNGVTLWKDGVVIGNYSVYNECVKELT